jgi:hypothetical protein
MPLGFGFHVLPLNDLIEHEAQPNCVCGPAPDTRPDDEDPSVIHFVFRHHALDGRKPKAA